MPIRWRLALWFGAMSSAVVLMVAFVGFATHDRSQYQLVDQRLVADAQHARDETSAELAAGETRPLSPPHSGAFVRVYDSQANVLSLSPPASFEPPLNGAQTLSARAGPASSGLLAWLPGGRTPTVGGAFATAREAGRGDRVRLYALPVTLGSRQLLVLTWTSLGDVDRAMARYQVFVLALAGTSVVAVALGSMLIAARVLGPISGLTRTARAIAVSRAFSRRLPQPARGGSSDELGELAATLNEMLAALEQTHLQQQTFLADAAHELRAPVTAIQANARLLVAGDGVSPADRAAALAFVEDEAGRLSRLVADLLALARADAGVTLERRPVELDAVVLETLAELKTLTAHHHVHLDRVEPVQLLGSRGRLRDLVVILVDNAVKYTPRGGDVRVGVSSQDGRAVISVADGGIGISSTALPHVFERFYRADAGRTHDPGGTGLGLAIAKWIVDQHDGEIDIESVPERGTTVRVRLPLSGGSAKS